MKTTIDLSDDLVTRVRSIARKRGITFRAVVEEGLHLMLKAETHPAPKSAPLVTFKGDGLAPEFAGRSWDAIRDAIYEGRGS
jgi:hypothetical protein